MKTSSAGQQAVTIFRRTRGMLHTSQAIAAGIHPRTLYELRDEGIIIAISRGVYRLADLPELGNPDLAAVAARVPKAVFCLISALHFHGLTNEIPHEVMIALPRGTATPRLDWPPLRVYRFSSPAYETGIETHHLEEVSLRIYSAAKSVADCFKFRNRIGLDVAIDALRTGLTEGKFTAAELMRHARICRVDRIIRPYLEAAQ